MTAVVHSPHVVSATCSSSGGGLVTLCLCSTAESLQQERVLYDFLQECFSHVILLLLSLSPIVPAQYIFPLLKSVIPKALPLSLMHSALTNSRSILGHLELGLLDMGGLLAACHRSHSYRPHQKKGKSITI